MSDLKKSNDDLKTPSVFHRTLSADISMFYLGSIQPFFVKGEESDGRVAMMQYYTKPGNEPPPHIHEYEHEIYYILEGIMEFYCEDKVLLVRAGEVIFLPQGKPHAFYIRSKEVKTLMLMIASGERSVGSDRYFMELATPAERMSLPEGAVTYQTVDTGHAIEVGVKNGVTLLSPGEAAEALPHYPGFGVKRELLD